MVRSRIIKQVGEKSGIKSMIDLYKEMEEKQASEMAGQYDDEGHEEDY